MNEIIRFMDECRFVCMFKKKCVSMLMLLVLMVIMLSVTTPAAKINKKKASVRVGNSIQLTISGLKAGKAIKWTSSDKSIASVTKKGKVTGRKRGTATITGRAGRKKYTCHVTVTEAKKIPAVGSSEVGEGIAEFAQKYVGLPYVYGGTSLTNGADCSGFCYAVFQKFGIQLMRVADDQMKGPSTAYQKLGYKKGIVIQDKDLMPGDLVFYCASVDLSLATHVAIYIGNGKVVHVAGQKEGTIISDIDYKHGRNRNRNMRYWS